MLNVRRLMAHAQRHDHLIVAVGSQLVVVALDVVGIGLHQVAVGVGEIPLGLVRRRAIILSGQTAPGHRLRLQRFEFRWFKACFLGCVDGLLSSNFRSCCCSLSSPVQLHLRSLWCIGLIGCISGGSGLTSLLLALTRCISGGLRFHFLTSLTNPLQTALAATQLIGQITATVVLAIAPVLLGIEDFGLTHQGIDLLCQLLLDPEHSLLAHGLVLAGVCFHLVAIQGHVPQAHYAGLLAKPQDLNKQTFEGIKVAAPKVTDPAADCQ